MIHDFMIQNIWDCEGVLRFADIRLDNIYYYLFAVGFTPFPGDIFLFSGRRYLILRIDYVGCRYNKCWVVLYEN